MMKLYLVALLCLVALFAAMTAGQASVVSDKVTLPVLDATQSITDTAIGLFKSAQNIHVGQIFLREKGVTKRENLFVAQAPLVTAGKLGFGLAVGVYGNSLGKVSGTVGLMGTYATSKHASAGLGVYRVRRDEARTSLGGLGGATFGITFSYAD